MALHAACIDSSGSGLVNIDDLCDSSYLSAVYAETLRLRSASIIMRRPKDGHLRVGRWLIPKGNIVGFTGWTTHFDERLWNTGTSSSPRSLQRFWPERFLVSADGRYRGPAKPRDEHRSQTGTGEMEKAPTDRANSSSGFSNPDTELCGSSAVSAPQSTESKDPPAYEEQSHFTTEGLQGIFLPFGGGSNMCPGRHYAKQEILLTVAVLLNSFEMQLSTPHSDSKASPRFFGTGVLTPQGSTPFRFRKRSLV